MNCLPPSTWTTPVTVRASTGSQTVPDEGHKPFEPKLKEKLTPQPQALPMLDAANWQQTRDLALLALASYSGKGSEDVAAEQEPVVDEDAA